MKLQKILTIALSLALSLSLLTFNAAATEISTSSETDTTNSTANNALDIVVYDPIEEPNTPFYWEEDFSWVDESPCWLAEQIRLQPTACGVYSDGTLYATFELATATKIICIADTICPTYYDNEGNLWLSGICPPCGINMRQYRFLELADHLASKYNIGGVDQLMELYSPEVLEDLYAELCELAPASYDAMIEQLNNYSITVNLTGALTATPPVLYPTDVVDPVIDEPIDYPEPNLELIPDLDNQNDPRLADRIVETTSAWQ